MKYARQCDITQEGMNEGWCWFDGAFYTKYEKDTARELHKTYDEEWGSHDWSDEDIIEFAYDQDVLYWTEWNEDDEEDGWFIVHKPQNTKQ